MRPAPAVAAAAGRAAAATAQREWLAQCSLLVVAVATLSRLWVDGIAWRVVAAAGLVLFVLAAWPRASRQARVFAALVPGAAALVHLQGQSLQEGLVQSAQFATLIAALATLRLPMRRSALVARAAASLLAVRPRARYAAVLFGSHWMGLVFSFGVVPLVGEMLRRAGRDVRADASAQDMVRAVVRGLALTTAWTPLSISFAIVSAALPGLGVLAFVGAGLATAGLVLAVDAWRHRPALPQEEPAGGPQDRFALCAILGLGVALFAVTWVLHRATGWSFMTASSVSIPVLSLAWAWCERGAPVAATAATAGAGPGIPPDRLARLRAELRTFLAALAETRSEVFIFCASVFIGAALLAVLRTPSGALPWGGLPPWVLLLACLWSIPLVASWSVAPTIMVLVWAQLFTHTPGAAAAPLAHALALTLGWSMAICVSPVSATLLMAGAITGVAPREVASRWNRGFVLRSGVLASAVLLGLYVLEG